MPITQIETPVELVPLGPPTKKWTREELDVIENAGILEGQKYELVNGEMISTTGKKRPHVITLVLIQAWLQKTFGVSFVNPEAPIDVAPGELATNEPEPDLIVLNCEMTAIRTRNPKPDEVRLAIEVSVSSLYFDLHTKADLYARAKIQEYWVVDVDGKRVIVHEEPKDGVYRWVDAFSVDETVSPMAAPEAKLLVADLFPA